VRDLVATRLPRRYGLSPSDIQVLTPMHRGELGAANLNLLLQEALLPGVAPLRPGERAFRVGDRVMQLRNNYDRNVYNGDVGKILAADRAVTAEMAARLGKYCGNGPELWLNMQSAYDLWHARQALADSLDEIPTRAAS